MLSAFASALLNLIAFVMGLIATVQLFRRRGTEKGMIFALSGILISVAIGAYDLLSEPHVEFRAEVPIIHGTPEGAFTLYNGRQPIVAGTFEKGRKEGLWTLWDARGIKTREITYRRGLKEGTFLGWYSSFAAPDQSAKGKLLYQGRFSFDSLDGPMTLYYPTGQVRCKFSFDHGGAKDTVCWNQQGKELSQTEAVESGRSEANYIDSYLKHYDQEVEKAIGQLSLGVESAAGSR